MPYTYKKKGDEYIVYKKSTGAKVGSTAGNKIALSKYLAALHMHENKNKTIKMKYIKTFEEFSAENPTVKKEDDSTTTDAADTTVEATNEAKKNEAPKDTKIAKIDAAIANLKGQSDSSLMNTYKRAQKEVAKSGKFGNWTEEESKKMISALKRNLKKRELVESEEITEADEASISEKLNTEIDSKVSTLIQELAKELESSEEEVTAFVKESIERKK